jgi:hypothetical protein
MSLKDALQSPVLKTIRDNHGRLAEARGSGALRVEREWAKSLLHASVPEETAAALGKRGPGAGEKHPRAPATPATRKES